MDNNSVGSVLPFLGASGEHGGGGVRVGGDDDLDLGGTSRLNFGTGFDQQHLYYLTNHALFTKFQRLLEKTESTLSVNNSIIWSL